MTVFTDYCETNDNRVIIVLFMERLKEARYPKRECRIIFDI